MARGDLKIFPTFLPSAGAAGLAGSTTAGVAAGAGAAGAGVAAGTGAGYLTSAAPGRISTDPTQPARISNKKYFSSPCWMDSAACLGYISVSLQKLLLTSRTDIYQEWLYTQYKRTRMAGVQ